MYNKKKAGNKHYSLFTISYSVFYCLVLSVVRFFCISAAYRAESESVHVSELLKSIVGYKENLAS